MFFGIRSVDTATCTKSFPFVSNFVIDFGNLFDVIWLVFGFFLHHFFEHRSFFYFSLIWGVDFGIIFDIVWYLFRSRTQPAKPSQTNVFTLSLNDFTIQKNMIFDYFHDLFRYKFWHWLLMSVGTDLGSIWASSWHQVPSFFAIVFLIIFESNFDDFWQENNHMFLWALGTQIDTFSTLFRRDVFEDFDRFG